MKQAQTWVPEDEKVASLSKRRVWAKERKTGSEDFACQDSGLSPKRYSAI